MTKTLSWRSVPVPVEMRLRYLRQRFIVCISIMQRQRTGKQRSWNVDDTGIGGMKSVTFMITGAGAYSVMKYESGVHRVQRVPETESGGRIHTSTITVAVMPEAEDVDVQIDEKDIRIDVCRAKFSFCIMCFLLL